MQNDTQLDRLETLAKRANQEPWFYEAGEVVAGEVAIADFTWNPSDGEFIAAADPQTMLDLVVELRAARKVIAKMRRSSSINGGWLQPELADYDQAAGHADR